MEEKIQAAEQAQQVQENDTLDTELLDVKGKLAELAKRMRDFKVCTQPADSSKKRLNSRSTQNEQRSMGENVNRLKSSIRHFEEQIEGARKIMDGSGREKQRHAQVALAKVDSEIDAFSVKVTEARTVAADLELEIDQTRGTYEGARNEVGAARQAFEQAEAMIRGIESRRTNALNAFGQHATHIMQLIDRDGGWVEKPVLLLPIC